MSVSLVKSAPEFAVYRVTYNYGDTASIFVGATMDLIATSPRDAIGRFGAITRGELFAEGTYTPTGAAVRVEIDPFA